MAAFPHLYASIGRTKEFRCGSGPATTDAVGYLLDRSRIMVSLPVKRGHSAFHTSVKCRSVTKVRAVLPDWLRTIEVSSLPFHQPPFNTIQRAMSVYRTETAAALAVILRDRNPAEAFGNVMWKEWNIIYLMTCNDFPSAVLPYWCMGVNILFASPFLQTGDVNHLCIQVVKTLTKEVFYSSLYLYCFNLANQYVGAPGDAINKPWRPIPAGLLTREGGLARCVLANLFYAFVSWHLGVLPWTLAWQGCIAGQFLGLEDEKSSGGLGRSLAMFIGTYVLCYVGVALATPMTPILHWWAVTRAAIAANHHWMQDFRDVEGDLKIGRTTFPILFGVENARKLMAVIFLMDPIFMHFVVNKYSSYTTAQLICEGVLALISAVLAYRVLNLKTAKDDHETYTMWLTTYWHNYCFLILGPALFQY